MPPDEYRTQPLLEIAIRWSAAEYVRLRAHVQPLRDIPWDTSEEDVDFTGVSGFLE